MRPFVGEDDELGAVAQSELHHGPVGVGLHGDAGDEELFSDVTFDKPRAVSMKTSRSLGVTTKICCCGATCTHLTFTRQS
jgi:hypothetical protein